MSKNNDINNILTLDYVMVDYEAETSEDAIQGAGELLLKKGIIEKSYIQAMINNLKEQGPYFVLLPGIAIPHAGSEEGVNKLGISIIKLKNPINFGHIENDPVELVIALASPNSEDHIGLLSSLSRVLFSPARLDKLKQVKSKVEVINLIRKWSKEFND